MEYILLGIMSSVVYLRVVSWAPFCLSFTLMTYQSFAVTCIQNFTFMQMILSCLGILVTLFLGQYYLQSCINKVGDWAKEWLLKLNVEKCCGMSFAANISNVCTTKYYIEEDKILHEIIKLESFKDLGVIFNSKLVCLNTPDHHRPNILGPKIITDHILLTL